MDSPREITEDEVEAAARAYVRAGCNSDTYDPLWIDSYVNHKWIIERTYIRAALEAVARLRAEGGG